MAREKPRFILGNSNDKLVVFLLFSTYLSTLESSASLAHLSHRAGKNPEN